MRLQPAFHIAVVKTEISCIKTSLWQPTRKTALPLHRLGEDAEVFIEVQSMSKTQGVTGMKLEQTFKYITSLNLEVTLAR